MKYFYSTLILFLLVSASAQLPTGGLIAYYPFDNNATDQSGKNNNGQITGGVNVTEDRFGNSCGALRFNGVDGYVRVPGSGTLKSPVNSMSITGWFKVEKGNTQAGNIQLILLSKSGTANKAEANAQYRFLLSRSFGDTRSTISLSQDVTATDNNYNAHPIEEGQWYFLAVVYEESWVNIFLNGKPIAQTIVKKPFTPNDFDLEIGRDITAGNKYFNGSLDDLRIYSRGLSPFEVSTLFSDESAKGKSEGMALTLPETINRNTDAGKCFALINYKEPAVSTGCGKVELKLVKGLMPGSAFGFGKNIITYQAISSSGQTLTDSFAIIISDNEPPVLKCPSDISLTASPGAKGARVEYNMPSVSDNCPNAKLELASGKASGAEFPEGVTTVRYKATDASGNNSECKFNVTVAVAKKAERVLHCPKDITIYTPADAENIIVKYNDPVIETEGRKTEMLRTKGFSSGSLYRVGKNEIIYETGDTGSENMICRFNVIVKDTIKPVISCPGDVIKSCEPGEKSTRVVFPLPKATDSGNGISVKILSGLMSGSTFPVGATTVKFETSDESGNRSECSFKITVQENKEIIREPVRIPPPVAAKPEAKKDIAVKAVEVPRSEAKEKAEQELKPKTESKEEREEKIRQAEKIFQPLVAEKKVEAKLEESKATITKTEPVEKIEDASKPLAKPVEEPKEKAIKEEDREEKIRKAEKIFQPLVAEKRPEPKSEESKATTTRTEPVAKIEETPKPLPKQVEELKEKIIIEEKKPAPPAVETVKPKDTAPAKRPKSPVPLVLRCPDNITIKTDAGKCGAFVNFAPPEIKTGYEAKLTQTKGISSSNFFKTGTTVNTFSASDVWGQRKECSFRITVKDEESPVFNCPDDTVIMLPANRRGIIYYYQDPSVKDNCAVDSFVAVSAPKNGCFLEIGVHPFIYKAVDASGNYQMCTHSVIIKSAPPAPNIEPPQKLDEQLSVGTDSITYEYKAKVKDCFLTIFIYDDGEEDNDIVSVIFNGSVIVNKEMIRIKEHGMIKRKLVLDGGNENYLVSKAWNTGKFGLNTLKIEVYEGNIENEKQELKYKKPVISKVLHSKPGNAGGIILKCSE